MTQRIRNYDRDSNLILSSIEARQHFRALPQAALQPYLVLRNLTNALKQAQPAAEDAAPHLVDHVERTASTLWKQMKDAFALDFESTLAKMKWPSKDVNLAGQLEHEWTEGVQRLLELQEPYVGGVFCKHPLFAIITLYSRSCNMWLTSMNTENFGPGKGKMTEAPSEWILLYYFPLR